MTASDSATLVHSRYADDPERGYALPGATGVGGVTKDQEPEAELREFSALAVEIRLRKGLTQREVAHNGGLSVGYVGMIEKGWRGTRPSRRYVLKLADGLRATPAERDRLLLAAGFPLAGPMKPPTYEQVVARDPRLRPDQREALIVMYRTMTAAQKGIR